VCRTKNNGGPGGLVRAATAVRVNGRFAPNPDGPARKRGDQIAVATVITMAKELTPVREKPAEAMTDAELFTDNFRRSMLFARDVLLQPVDWSDQDMLKLKRDISLGAQSLAIRMKVAELRPPPDENAIERIMARAMAIHGGRDPRMLDVTPQEGGDDKGA